MAWTEHDLALTEEDLITAKCKGIAHPVFLRLSPASPAAQAIFEAIHRKPMSGRAWLPSDVEAVTEVLNVERAMSLLVEHQGERGHAIVKAMKHFRASQDSGKLWWVIDIRSDGTTHETHIIRDQKESNEQPRRITIDCGTAGIFTMVDDPMVITTWFVSVLQKNENARQAVTQQIATAFLDRLEGWPDHVAYVLDVMREQKRKGEGVILRALQATRFHGLASRVENVLARQSGLQAGLDRTRLPECKHDDDDL